MARKAAIAICASDATKEDIFFLFEIALKIVKTHSFLQKKQKTLKNAALHFSCLVPLLSNCTVSKETVRPRAK
jgi:hypothetical protein